MEEWRPVKGYDIYEVSNLGNIRNKDTNRMIKPRKDKGGYMQINLYKDKIERTEKVHRLVAFAFIPLITGKTYIDHINGNRSDNRAENLRWCTIAENNQFPLARLHSKNKAKSQHGFIKPCREVLQFATNGTFIKKWNSGFDAAKSIGFSPANLFKACNGKRRTAGGYIWKFAQSSVI